MSIVKYLYNSISVLESITQDAQLQSDVKNVINVISKAIQNNKPILICGNGGSASDAEHFAAELVGRYLKNRPAIKAYALTTTGASMTALSNDFGYKHVFSRQVEAYGEQDGVLIGISTSGKSENVLEAFKVAKEKGMICIALIGQNKDHVKKCDHILAVPSSHTPHIQQAHLCLYHYICEQVEETL